MFSLFKLNAINAILFKSDLGIIRKKYQRYSINFITMITEKNFLGGDVVLQVCDNTNFLVIYITNVSN